MDFTLVQEVSADVEIVGWIAVELSDDLESYFKHKSYGNGIKRIIVRVTCVAPESDPFFKQLRDRLVKEEARLSSNLKLEYKHLVNIDDKLLIKKYMVNELLKSTEKIAKRKKLDFDYQAFRKDFEEFIKINELALNDEDIKILNDYTDRMANRKRLDDFSAATKEFEDSLKEAGLDSEAVAKLMKSIDI